MANNNGSPEAFDDNPYLKLIKEWLLRQIFIRLVLFNVVVLAGWALVLSSSIGAGSTIVDDWGKSVLADEAQTSSWFCFSYGTSPAQVGAEVANQTITARERLVGLPPQVASTDFMTRFLGGLQRILDSVTNWVWYGLAETGRMAITLAISRGTIILQLLIPVLGAMLAVWHLGAAGSRERIQNGYSPSSSRAKNYLELLAFMPATATLLLIVPLPLSYVGGAPGAGILLGILSLVLCFNFRREMFYI